MDTMNTVYALSAPIAAWCLIHLIQGMKVPLGPRLSSYPMDHSALHLIGRPLAERSLRRFYGLTILIWMLAMLLNSLASTS